MERRPLVIDSTGVVELPAGDTLPGVVDEKVAVVSGGTPNFLWGTAGGDGVIRMHSSMTWTKDSSDEFVTIAVAAIDGGTF